MRVSIFLIVLILGLYFSRVPATFACFVQEEYQLLRRAFSERERDAIRVGDRVIVRIAFFVFIHGIVEKACVCKNGKKIYFIRSVGNNEKRWFKERDVILESSLYV